MVIVWNTLPMTDAMLTPEPPEHTDTSEATFGMKRAAEVAGISVSTIRRHKGLLRKYGAIIEPDGWKVPMSALIASGLMRPQKSPIETQPEKQLATTDQFDELNKLKMELQELRHRAELAEERQRSAEQQARDVRELADSLSETLTIERRMLTAGTRVERGPAGDPEPKPETSSVVEKQASEGASRSWWRRLIG